jgi:hypothetical protein
MSTSPKVRITQSLLSAWEWSFKTDDGWDDLIATLNREKKQPTKAMLDGIRYENVLNNVLKGEPLPPEHEWYKPIWEMTMELSGARQQVNLFQDCEVGGQPFLLHGVLDYLREGHIWDCKFSKNYHLNKYLTSPQTPMYMALVPEARDFTYIISDGNYVYRERYPRDIVPPIEPTIYNFMQYLKKHGLWEVYCEKWKVV